MQDKMPFALHLDSRFYNTNVKKLFKKFKREKDKKTFTRNAWQSLAYSLLGAVVSLPSEY